MIEKAAAFLKSSSVIVVGAGAGMGKDSGLPDFRGDDGFWNNYPPYRNKFNFYQCANPNFLLEHPHLFWGFYGSRLAMYRQKVPHQGFHILKSLAEKMKPSEASSPNIFAVTSNVDGHFAKASYANNQIYEVHGSIHHLQCNRCAKIKDNLFQPDIDYEQMSCRNLPMCSHCEEIERPNILMFGDWDWNSERSDFQQQNYKTFLKQYKDCNVVIVEIGCGTAVPTIRNMMEELYYSNKKSKFIRINMDPQISSSKWYPQDRYVDVHLGALQALKQIQSVFLKK